MGGGGESSSSSPGKNRLSELLACPIGLKPGFLPIVELEEPAAVVDGRTPEEGDVDLRRGEGTLGGGIDLGFVSVCGRSGSPGKS